MIIGNCNFNPYPNKNLIVSEIKLEGNNQNDLIKNKQIIEFQPQSNQAEEKKRWIPERDFCRKALQECKINSSLEDSTIKGKEGGNGTVCFTTDGKYAVKRGVDLQASIPEKNEINLLEKAVKEILLCKPKGFEMNLPIGLFHICNSKNQKANCNIQIFPKVNTVEGKKDMGDVVREYVGSKSQKCLNIIESLGRQLALFHNTSGIDCSDGHAKGLQHGDFNAGNILVTDISNDGKNSQFTLIDNADFHPRKRIISDLVCFIYFTTILWGNERPAQYKDRMTDVINGLYKGYMQALPKDVYKLMSERIFSSKAAGALAEAQGDSYPKAFLNSDKWNQHFENIQREAFKNANAHDNSSGSSGVSKTTKGEGILKENVINAESLSLFINLEKVNLSAHKNLKYIDCLGKMTNLKDLNLSHTKVEAIFPLQSAKNLEVLNLRYCEYLEDVTPLNVLKNLKELNLSHTKVKWVGCLGLGNMTKLEILNLSGNKQIDDNSDLAPLEKLLTLKTIDLTGTKVSSERMEILSKALPKCTILRNQL